MHDPVILICGGRDYAGWREVGETVAKIAKAHPNATIRAGAAKGADTLALCAAAAAGLHTEAMPADWATHGRAAGPIRNREMLKREPAPTYVVAFPGGRGTEDMCKAAIAAGVRVLRRG